MFETQGKSANFVSRLRDHVQVKGDERVFVYLTDGESEEESVTFSTLDRQARAIGARLQELNLAGERVLLLFPPGMQYVAAFLGCLYAAAIAVPAYPPDPYRLERTLPRLLNIIKDSKASHILTSESIFDFVPMLSGQAPELQAVHWLVTEKLAPELSMAWKMPSIEGDTLAFLQYTSGSTGHPKGVMVSHGNLIHNSSHLAKILKSTAEEHCVVSWLPNYHDMGLIGGILQPIYLGCLGVLMSPLSFMRRPIRWLHAISKFRATTSPFPNFALDLCVRKFDPEQDGNIDLSSWKLGFNGAEPIRVESLERFTATFRPHGFDERAMFPVYGLAEGTLIASHGTPLGKISVKHLDKFALQKHEVRPTEFSTESAHLIQSLVSCGSTLHDQKILIVDPETQLPCRDNQVGEVWLSGPSVAKGYWGREAETQEHFQARPAGFDEGSFLRTGDLGFLENGQLYITGRRKDLIILDGKNHYPQDIELTIEKSDKALRPGCGAVFSVGDESEGRLVAVHEVDRRYSESLGEKNEASAESIFQRIRKNVAYHHELPLSGVVLVEAGTIPKTSSGKIQRQACKAAYLNNELQIVDKHFLGNSQLG